MKYHTYISVLKAEKQFKLMIIANIISRFGDSIDAIAYGWMVYQLTESKAWLAVILGVNMIPTILFQPLSGALTEFFNKKSMVVCCDFLRGGIVCLTGILMIQGVLTPWHLLVLTFVNSSFEALRVPNGTALIPEILKKENYKAALSLNQGASRTAELIGIGCAGAIIGIAGVGGALIIDAITFFLSGIFLSFIKVSTDRKNTQEFHVREYFTTLKEGFYYFKKSPLAIMVCLICVILNLSLLPIENLQAAYISEFLNLDVMAMSVGSTAMTVGMILGALFLPILSKHISDRKILLGGGIFIGVLYFAYIMTGYISFTGGKYVCYAVTAFIFGFINSLIGVAVQIIFMTKIPDELVGRISSIFTALACSLIPVGSFVLAALSTVLSIAQIYALTGVLSIIVFIALGTSKGMKEIDVM